MTPLSREWWEASARAHAERVERDRRAQAERRGALLARQEDAAVLARVEAAAREVLKPEDVAMLMERLGSLTLK